jgi:hypothetical protein
MKPTMKSLGQITSCMVLVAASGMLASSHAAFEKGDKVWSKHVETALLAEPRPLAASVATVGFAEKLKVKAVQGVWLNVKGDQAEGWIFQGNVAGEKPELAPSVGLTQVAAAGTDTVAAARPLAPAAQGYAERHGASDAQAGIDWVDAQAALLSNADRVAWMSEHQLGEYQAGEQP